MKKNFLQTIFFTLLIAAFIPQAYAGFTLKPGNGEERQLSFELEPGQTQEASVEVENLDKNQLYLNFYSADATQSNQGTFALTSIKAPQQHIGTWVNFTTPKQTIDPKEKRQIPFTIKVPENITPGTYGGGIAAETTTAGNNSQNGAVKVNARMFIKLFIKVPGEKKHEFEWSDFSYVPATVNTKPQFTLKYKNLGNTVIIASQKIEIANMLNGEMKIVELPDVTLLQGKEQKLFSNWENAPTFGNYKITATVTYSEYDITTNKKINDQILTKEIPLNMFNPNAVNWQVVIGISILLLLIIGYLLMKKILFTRTLKNSNSYLVQEKDTLLSIAEAKNIHWKKIAKVNKLKAPYNLHPGEKILIPQNQHQSPKK